MAYVSCVIPVFVTPPPPPFIDLKGSVSLTSAQMICIVEQGLSGITRFTALYFLDGSGPG